MPIDWEAIVAPFRAAFRSQTKYFTESVREIAKWLKKRLEESRKMEQMSRAFPVIDFSEGAVQMSIGLFQQHTLKLPEQKGRNLPVDEHLSAGKRFLLGLQRVPDALEEALAIPRLVRVVDQALAAIVDSLKRWEDPDWHMFDTKQKRSFSDIFGQLFFFLEMLTMSIDPIRVIINSEVARLLLAPSKTPSTSSGDMLAMVIQYMVSALLLIPIGGMWLASLFRWGIISIKFYVLSFLTGIENMVYDLRRQALEFVMGTLVGTLENAYLFVTGARDVMLEILGHILRFGKEVVQDFTHKLRVFLDDITIFMIDGVRKLFIHLLDALRRLPELDVWGGFTIQDLIDIATGKAWVKYHLLHGALSAAQDLADDAQDFVDDNTPGQGLGVPVWKGPKRTKERLEAAQEMLEILKNLPDKTIPGGVLPAKAASFPNIADYFNSLNSIDMKGSLKKLAGTLETELPVVLDTAGDAFTQIGDEFDKSAAASAWIGPTQDITKLRNFADSTVNAMFGQQVKDLHKKQEQNALALAFELAMASGGFHIVGAAIPLYVESMREFWEQQPPPEPLPTSPHILAKRSRLGCVKLPAIKIRTTGRELDDPLISRIANEFRQAVQGAWTSGLKALDAGA
jgi:hypothetical protein